MPGPGSTGRNLYGPRFGLIYKSEPKLGSELGLVYKSEPKIVPSPVFLEPELSGNQKIGYPFATLHAWD